MIGKYKNPRCFKHIAKDRLPLVYDSQSNASTIFANWFHQQFVPTVRKKLQELGVEPKAVLVLDNCSAHPNEDELVSSDGKIIAKFLPPNVTSLIQPMDQGVLESLKRRYRRKILEELVFKDEEGVPILEFLKSLHMLRVSNLIAACWSEIPAKTLQLSWRKILPACDVGKKQEQAVASQEATTNTEESLVSMFRKLGHELTESELDDWLQSDQHDVGYTHFNDDEIISSIVQEECDKSDGTDDNEVQEIPKVGHGEAVKMFDGCIQWLQEQDEASVYNITVLQELRELAARKRIGALQQRKVSDFFTPCS